MIYLEEGYEIDNRAIIGYDNVANRSTFELATSEAEGWPGVSVTNPFTYGGWRPEVSPASIEFGSINKPVDFVGIAAHNLGSLGVSVAIKINGSTVGVVNPQDDSSILYLFEERLASSFELEITYTGSDAPTVTVVSLGKRLTMPHTIYGEFTPPNLSPKFSLRPQLSEKGKILGRTAIRQAYTCQPKWDNLNPNWYRQYFHPFVLAAATIPFFFAWRPNDWREEVIYGQTSGNIEPVNNGVRGLMSVEVNIEGVG